jgi:hypothetical protein
MGPRGPVRGAVDFLRLTPARHSRAVRRSRDRFGRAARPQSRPRGVVDTLMRGQALEGLSPGAPYHTPGFARGGGVRPAVSQPVGSVPGGPRGKRRQCAVGFPHGHARGQAIPGKYSRVVTGQPSIRAGVEGVDSAQESNKGRSPGLPLEHENTWQN